MMRQSESLKIQNIHEEREQYKQLLQRALQDVSLKNRMLMFIINSHVPDFMYFEIRKNRVICWLTFKNNIMTKIIP